MTKVLHINQRSGKVQPKCRQNSYERTPHTVPHIRLEGRWLEAVTEPGDCYTVHVHPEARALTLTFGQVAEEHSGIMAAFTDHLDGLYYSGYADQLAKAHPEAYRFELHEFLTLHK